MSGERTLTDVVEVRSVYRHFGDKTVLQNVSFQVEAGRIHALIGPNGVGKTTLLRIVAGLTEPSSGSVAVLGRSPRHADVRRQIGWVPSGDRSLYLRLSGYENLLFFARLYGIPKGGAARRATEAMHKVGLSEAMRQPAGLYSHGMQKRTAIARAFLADPKVLLFDEATHDLDPAGAGEVRDLVQVVASQGTGVLWATQRIEELRGFADTVTLLTEVGVRYHGPVERFIQFADRRVYLVELGAVDGSGADLVSVVAPFGTLHHDARDGFSLLSLRRDAVLGDAIGALAAAGIPVFACREARPEIEEAFLTLVQERSDDD